MNGPVRSLHATSSACPGVVSIEVAAELEEFVKMLT